MIWVVAAIAIIEAIIIVLIWLGASLITQANKVLMQRLNKYETKDSQVAKATAAPTNGASGADDDTIPEPTGSPTQGRG